MSTKNPCYNGGEGCPLRHQFCHHTCQQWAEWEAENKKRLKARYEHPADAVRIEHIIRTRVEMKKSKNKRTFGRL